MKNIYLILLLLPLLFVAQSCNKELPYPIDDVKKGVLIDISRIPGTDGLLSAGATTGDYKLKVLIPENQGDYSIMKHAQLLAVLQKSGQETKTAVVMDNLTEFPKEIQLDIADVYNKLGLGTPTLGETLYFTTNVVLNNGDVIPGWTEHIGFNNKAFSGWSVDDRAYSYNVRYMVACGWDRDPNSGTFIGTFTMEESSSYGDDSYSVTLSHNPNTPDPAAIPIGVLPESLYGINISPISPNIWEPKIDVVTIWVNTEDLSLVIPNQDTGDKYSTGDAILWYDFKDTSINTCDQTIQFTAKPYMPGVGGWGEFTFTIHP
jgi:hypothetical protein